MRDRGQVQDLALIPGYHGALQPDNERLRAWETVTAESALAKPNPLALALFSFGGLRLTEI